MNNRKWHGKLHSMGGHVGWRCFYCAGLVVCWRCTPGLALEATRDHIVPRSQGGDNRYENLVLACRGCNEDRADMAFDLYLAGPRSSMDKSARLRTGGLGVRLSPGAPIANVQHAVSTDK